MSGSEAHQSPVTDSGTGTSESRQYTPRLLDHAELLVVAMGSKLPADGLQVGVLQQLEGKSLEGANCTSIIVFPASHAVFVDYNTGVHVRVDTAGRRSTAMLRPSR